jgi:hypothetical protein
VTIHLLSGTLPTKNGESEGQAGDGDGDGQGADGQSGARLSERQPAARIPDGECDQFLGKMAVKFIHQQKEPERRELFFLPTRPAASTIRGFVRIEQ